MNDPRRNNAATKVAIVVNPEKEGKGKEYLRVEYQPDRPENVAIEYGYMATCDDPSCPTGGPHPRVRRIRIPLSRLAEALAAAQELASQAPSTETLQ